MQVQFTDNKVFIVVQLKDNTTKKDFKTASECRSLAVALGYTCITERYSSDGNWVIIEGQLLSCYK